MADNLNGIKKEFWSNGGFRMILKDAVTHRPGTTPFDPKSEVDMDIQVEEWKAKSAEQRGFDNAFHFITGHKITDLGETK